MRPSNFRVPKKKQPFKDKNLINEKKEEKTKKNTQTGKAEEDLVETTKG